MFLSSDVWGASAPDVGPADLYTRYVFILHDLFGRKAKGLGSAGPTRPGALALAPQT